MRTRAVGAVFIAIMAALSSPVGAPATASPGASPKQPNIVIFVSDDQRADMVTPEFTPNIYEKLVKGNPYAFTQGFAPNPLCCPSRTSILTGNYSHTTGVWTNSGPHGGFAAFHDAQTISVDFQEAGYRTGMIGKYLNGYKGGEANDQTYVAPGWDTWFALSSGQYFDFGVTTEDGFRAFGSGPEDYSTRVIEAKARSFVESAVDARQSFFMYVAFTAPHQPATPDPLDVGRFSDVTPEEAGAPVVDAQMLESAYGVDRAVGHLLDVLPDNTIVVYLSDNGYLWGEHGMSGKDKPYNQSVRIPIILKSLDGSYEPPVGTDDLVLNVDLRPTLTAAAGVPQVSGSEGIDWGASNYRPRSVFPLEGYREHRTFCGAREADWMYTRFSDGRELLFNEALDPQELVNLDPSEYPDDYARLNQEARTLCFPVPPGYSWSAKWPWAPLMWSLIAVGVVFPVVAGLRRRDRRRLSAKAAEPRIE